MPSLFALLQAFVTVFRVEEYVASGKDKTVFDPDPNRLYTKRKLQKIGASSCDPVLIDNNNKHRRFVKYPENGWNFCLKKMPMFTKAEMSEHISRSGKTIAGIEHHSVPTSLRKAKTFLDDEYLHEIMATSDDKYFYFRSKCYHSYRKNDPPHELKITLCILKGTVIHSSCTCVAGQVGYCNHISALMLKLCKFSLFEAKTTKDLCEENDENPTVACTSKLQKWHKKGGGENIHPEPLMDVVVKKTKVEESSNKTRGGQGVKCLLYDARKTPQYDCTNEHELKSELAKIDSNLGFSQILSQQGLAESVEIIDSRFGETRVGSFLSYQTSFTEASFDAKADLISIPRNIVHFATPLINYPRFPLGDENCEIDIQKDLCKTELKLLNYLSVDEDEINMIERNTRSQAESDEWRKQRTYRFTASKFQLITRRQRNHETFVQSLIYPKTISSKHLAHGIKYEPIALQEYEKFMFNQKTPVTVLKSGLVISKCYCFLGATPDARIIDTGCSICFGLAEVKCPSTKFNVTPLDACSDQNFFMEKISSTRCRLKRNHAYFTQVQGQMGVTGCKW